MALATITARVDEKDKIRFDAFCSNVGLNTSAAINLFVKAVLRENRIPFEIAQASDHVHFGFFVLNSGGTFEQKSYEQFQ